MPRGVYPRKKHEVDVVDDMVTIENKPKRRKRGRPRKVKVENDVVTLPEIILKLESVVMDLNNFAERLKNLS